MDLILVSQIHFKHPRRQVSAHEKTLLCQGRKNSDVLRLVLNQNCLLMTVPL